MFWTRPQAYYDSAEITLDELLVGAGPSGNLPRRRGIEAAGGEDLHGGLEQRLLGRNLVAAARRAGGRAAAIAIALGERG